MRDPSSIAIGIVMPVVLILLFGYGLSLDVSDVPVAVVLEDPSPAATELAAAFSSRHYFDAPRDDARCREARSSCCSRKVDGIVRIRPISRAVGAGNAEVQVLVHGSRRQSRPHHPGLRAGRDRPMAGAAQPREGRSYRSAARSVVQSRLWFNEANESHYFLVPGLIVLVMTLIGALLTALVMAREWERGTLEALFVTPVRTGEILLGKTVPYFVLGMIGLVLCLLAAKFLFHVPLRGSLMRPDRRFDALPAGRARHRPG